jgi:hypothetical protein
MTDSLADIRRDLAEAQGQLAAAKDRMRRTRLLIEIDLLTSVDGDAKKIGSNEEDRRRVYDSKCELSPDYVQAVAAVRDLMLVVAKLEAERDIRLDDRFERDLDVRKRNIDAIWRTEVVA